MTTTASEGEDESKLSARLDQAEGELKAVSDSAQLSEQCAGLLARARAELASERFVEAHDLTLRLECLLLRAHKSEETLRRWGPFIGIYEVVILGCLLFLILWGPGQLGLRSDTAPWGMVLLPYCVWGAIGGVVAALFGMYFHGAQRDFDRAYLVYYYFKPLLGVVLGPLVYLFAKAGLIAMQGSEVEIERHELLYLGAFVVGFAERYSLRLIDRVATAIFGPAGSAAAGSAAVAPAVGLAPVPPPAPAETPEASGAIRVHVTGPGPGGLADVSVRLLQDGEELETRGPGPDEDGVFLFTDLALGAYGIEASKPGWLQAGAVTVELTPAQEQADAEIVLERDQ